jgi:hypothetical protein
VIRCPHYRDYGEAPDEGEEMSEVCYFKTIDAGRFTVYEITYGCFEGDDSGETWETKVASHLTRTAAEELIRCRRAAYQGMYGYRMVKEA